MERFSWTIHQKLTFNILFASVGLLLVGGYLYSEIQNMEQKRRQLASLNLLKTTSVEFAFLLLASKDDLRSLLLDDRPEMKSQILARNEIMLGRFEEFKNTASKSGSKSDYYFATEYEPVIEDIDSSFRRSILFYEQGNKAEAQALSTGRLSYRIQRILSFVKKASKLRNELIQALDIATQKRDRDLLRNSIVLISLIIGLALLFSLRTTYSITRALAILTNVAQKITDDNDLQIRAEIHNTDEIKNLAVSFNTMTEKLLAARIFSEKIIQSMLDALFVASADGQILTSNPAAQSLMGLGPEALVGQSLKSMLPDRDVKLILDTTDESIIDKESVLWKEKGKEKIPVTFTCSAIEEGTLATWVLIVRDIRNLKRAQEAEFAQHESRRLADLSWLKSQLLRITKAVQSHTGFEGFASAFINELTTSITGSVAAFYLLTKLKHEKNSKLQLIGPHPTDNSVNHFELGQGLIGLCARKQQVITIATPDDYFPICSGLGGAKPSQLTILPILFEEQLLGVAEIATLQELTNLEKDLIQQITNSLGVYMDSLASRLRTEGLLIEAQTVAEQMQQQSEELQQQSEELQQSNEQLEEQTLILEKNRKEIEIRNRALEVAQENLIRSGRYKSEFMSNMSHELRTPLNSIVVLSQLLTESGEMSEKSREYAKAISEAGADLLNMINEILDLAQVQAGKMTFLPESFELRPYIMSFDVVFQPQAKQKGLILHTEISHHLPSQITTDKDRLRQILNNLISNALKFTEKGEVTLKVQKAESYPNGGIAIVVQDTGTGISKEAGELIFQPFQQGDGSTNRRFGGTGLGLAIVQKIVALAGGWIHFESELGQGSVFTVELPLIAPERKAELRECDHKPHLEDIFGPDPLPKQKSAFNFEQDEESDKPLKQEKGKTELIRPEANEMEAETTPSYDDEYLKEKTILLVDDDARNTYALLAVLEKFDLHILIASNGREALDALDKHPKIDLVIMDMMMPTMDGYETMKHIRADKEKSELPIIALTAKATRGARARCLDAGASDYLPKPMDYHKLITLMKTWLRSSSG